VSLSECEKFKDIITRFDTTHERDRQTDTVRRHRPRVVMIDKKLNNY